MEFEQEKVDSILCFLGFFCWVGGCLEAMFLIADSYEYNLQLFAINVSQMQVCFPYMEQAHLRWINTFRNLEKETDLGPFPIQSMGLV